jgi:hypothetical protein
MEPVANFLCWPNNRWLQDWGFFNGEAGKVEACDAKVAGAANVCKWSDINAIMKSRFSEKPDGVV